MGASTISKGAAASSGEGSSDSKKAANRKAEKAFNRSVRDWHARHTPKKEKKSDDIGTKERIDPRAEVFIGDDRTLDPNYGDKYESDDADSYQDSALSASYDTYSNWVRGRAYDYAGYGTFRAWSYVGREFVVNGDSSQTATVTVRPDVCGDMTIGVEGDNLGRLALIVKDFDDNEEYSEYVFNHSGYVKQWCDDSYITSQNVILEPGHGYTVLAKLTVGTTFTGDAGSALSDFNQSTDGDETVDVGTIDIKF